MPHELPKAYDPTAIEDHWAAYWVREKLFAQPTPEAGERLDGKPFVILLPPPNVTGNLHMGHMFEHTESDILIRWRRMCGDAVLWIPGTDHAGIATQMLVERQLANEGTSRQQLGREAFEARVWEWRRHYGGNILNQMKRLGASVDWDREYFTMDVRLSVAVREAFVRLHHEGLIYRGAYIVNWCPRCQTAISDLEVTHEEQKGHLWEIRYPVLYDDGTDSDEFVTVATTRPETMLGDTAVAVHPEDERYKHLHGKKLRLPLMDRVIPIVTDEWVSRDFGTGAVKVTPAHDPNDFALGERHHLPKINVMDETAHINAEGGPYAGLDRYVARKKIIADLEALGLLAGVKDHVNNIGHCARCSTVVEPRLSMQWFVAVNKSARDGELSIAARAREAVKEKHIRIIPEQYEKIYLNWMENIYDWCISRQLWWGHRIPAWHCPHCGKITVPQPGVSSDPEFCDHCGRDGITQETDVLDTWFSSGLLPVSVFGWPRIDETNRADFDAFYPTKLLVTGFDILFFWVARMIMLGSWFSKDVPLPDGSPRPLGETVPFRTVYIHALVRDANREKMSKTKGNVLDPIEIVKKYGTDAVRFTLASMASPGTDIAFSEARTEGYRAFANKIWNAARFIFMNVDKAAEVGITVDRSELGKMPTVAGDAPLEARWIVAELHSAAQLVNEELQTYRFDEAANSTYQFFWGSFCDWYLEIVKLRLDFSESADKTKTKSALTTLVSVFETALRLLSPFMPFITEELWQAVYDRNPSIKSVALARFPESGYTLNARDSRSQVEMQLLQDLISVVRDERKNRGIPEKESVPISIISSSLREFAIDPNELISQNSEIVQRLGKISTITFLKAKQFGSEGLIWRSVGFTDVALVHEKPIDLSAERERLTKEIAKYEKNIASAERQLNNESFLAKAPAHIVEGLRKQREENRLLLDKARAALDALPPENGQPPES